jgi:uncharacterized protein with HEPN domain
MPSRSPKQRLQDIIDNIEIVRSFIAGMDEEAFHADRRTSYAVSRALEIISEASRRLPSQMKNRHPQIPWREIAAAGNIYRHEYEAIDNAITWKTATEDLTCSKPLPRQS